LVVTNGGTMGMTAVTTGNFRVGNSGGDNLSATNILDVSGTINLLTSSGVVGNSAVIVGGSGLSDILNVRSPGNLMVRAITGSSPGNTEAHFYGGTLTALTTDAAFINGLTNAWLETGGLTIDSVSNAVTVPQLLSGSGGLTKIGTGRLVLDGANTYTGPTLVSQGILGGNGVISGPVSVASGATLAPGSTTTIGTLTISNNLTLNTGSTVSVQVNKDDLTKDLVTGLTNIPSSYLLLRAQGRATLVRLSSRTAPG
jgi:autotransporter-associated beta strand protein